MNKDYETIGEIVWHNLCHTVKAISDEEFIESIKKQLGEEPKQQELF